MILDGTDFSRCIPPDGETNNAAGPTSYTNAEQSIYWVIARISQQLIKAAKKKPKGTFQFLDVITLQLIEALVEKALRRHKGQSPI